ncbi:MULTISPECIES: hypothetical protein [Streptomyces]|uniref:hypothetical protein n=1 Tax=Streptomyces TaxID=1883 RepID=UPI0036F64677
MRWWRRINWTKVSTAVGVVLGIGTLAFTGIATYYQALMADDALKQSRDDSEKDAKSQASLITFWQVTESPAGGVVYIQNRSPDVIVHPWLYISGSRKGEPEPSVGVQLNVPVLPPCSRLTFPVDTVKKMAKRSKQGLLGDSSTYWNVAAIEFTDIEGRRWYRDYSGPRKGVVATSDDFPTVKVWGALFDPSIEMKSARAPACEQK